jgi:hypothetical protein
VTLKAKDGAEKAVDVTIGRSDGENVEITGGGLSEGDEVVIMPMPAKK